MTAGQRRRDRRNALATEPLRIVAYARVSRAREDMDSPEIQLTSIREWAVRKGHIIVDEIVDPDATGRNFNRDVQRAIEMVEQGDADGICVYKFSRFGRDLAGFQVNMGRIVRARGDLHSSTEEVDATTAAGQLSRDMLAVIAAFESNRYSEQWKDSVDLRLSRGLPHTGTPHFGYRHHKCDSQPVTSAGWRIRNAKDPECRTGGDCHEEYRVDPSTGSVLADLYKRSADGEGLADLAAWCNETGQPRDRGGRWYPSSVADLLDSGFGAGLLRVGVKGTKGRPDKDEAIEYLQGAHEPVIDRDTWDRYLTRRKAVAGTSSSLKRSVWPLTGLILCGLCGDPMTCASSARGRGYTYRCATAQNLKTCKGVWRTRSAIESAMFAELDAVADVLADRARALAPTVRRQKSMAKRQRSEAEKGLADVKAAKKRLVGLAARGTLSEEDIAEEMAELNAKARRFNKTLEAAAVAPRPINSVVIRSLRDDWSTLPVDTARSMARLLVRSIVCHSDKRIEVTLAPALTAQPPE